MNRKEFMDNIVGVINDWKNTSFTFIRKSYVPGLDDTILTYGNGEEKKGIELYTCVLFVDIRDSVQLTKDKQLRTMGRLYSVFTHCMLLAAQQEGGYVRNIIGDRVMIVFPKDGCYTNAVNCATTINHIATLIDKKIDNIGFKCGIGIDYGKVSIMKVGIVKKGAENDDNKGLVWVGYPANYASRLADCANKEFTDTVYQVDADFYEYNSLEVNLCWGEQSGWYRKKVELTAEELAESATVDACGRMCSKKFRKPRFIKKLDKKYIYNPILLSENVYKGYKAANPNENSIKNNWWNMETRKIRDIEFNVWGANLFWKLG